MELRRTLQHTLLALGALGFGLSAPLAQAGVITNAGQSFGDGLGFAQVAVVSTGSPGVDNGNDSSNIVVPIKRFDANGVIDIEFFVSSSDTTGPVTEYLFVESVDNNTLVDWSSYVIELGFGTGANFDPSDEDDGLDFDYPDFTDPPTSTAFSNVIATPDLLAFTGGIQDTGSRVYRFRVDVPNGIQVFTLRQYPVPVPEPATLALAATGLVGLFVASRVRRKR